MILTARFDALSRTYHYIFSKIKNPFNINCSILLMRKLNIMHMNLACEQYIIGSKDFTSFAKLHTHNFTNNCNVMLANC